MWFSIILPGLNVSCPFALIRATGENDLGKGIMHDLLGFRSLVYSIINNHYNLRNIPIELNIFFSNYLSTMYFLSEQQVFISYATHCFMMLTK
jgi:hypothetical protein